jgi:hypothetical protein
MPAFCPYVSCKMQIYWNNEIFYYCDNVMNRLYIPVDDCAIIYYRGAA